MSRTAALFMSAHSYGALCQTGASWREPPFGSPQRTLWAVRPAGRFATIPPRWPLPRTCCVHARLSAMVRGLAERVAVTAESRVAPSCDASSSHAPVTDADRGDQCLLIVPAAVGSPVGPPINPPRPPTIVPWVVAPPIRSPINPPSPPVRPAVDPPPVTIPPLAPVGLDLLQIDVRFT